MTHTRVLFVDDESNVLDGLRRMLRPMRQDWDMLFATTGEEALSLMAAQPINVVVSDMRMPGMDGRRLLTEVRHLYPDMVRILLSGQSDRAILLQSVGLAHQFLAKPCAPELIKTTIAQACRLRALLKQESLRRLISRVDVLPSLPAPYLELVEELRSPEASVERAGRIIARDMGMTAKILQLVNSAYFGLRRYISDPATAASLLGLDTIKALVLSVQVFRQLESDEAVNFSPEALWAHSVNVGAFAQAIARAEKQNETFIGNALMGGLLHDIGRLLLATRFSTEYKCVVSNGAEHRYASPIEHDVFGATHAEVSAYMLGLWGMVDQIVEAAAFHHEPGRAVNTIFTPLTAVFAANLIDYEMNPKHALLSDPTVTMAVFDASPYADRITIWRAVCVAIEEEHLKCMKKSY